MLELRQFLLAAPAVAAKLRRVSGKQLAIIGPLRTKESGMNERTLVLVKPDAVARGLLGEILCRFERAGLKIEAIRVSNGEAGLAHNHYPSDEDWLRVVGGKTIEDYEVLDRSTIEQLGTDSPVEIGRIIRSRLVKFLQSDPLVPMILSGNRAIENVRKLVGSTLPVSAEPGTIRGDFGLDSTDLANAEDRPVMNLVHASGNPTEAVREIRLWFGDDDDR